MGLLIALAARLRPRQTSRLAFYPLGFGASLALLLHIPRLYPLAYLLLACGLTCRAARGFDPLAPGFRRIVRLSLPVLLIAVGALIGLDYRQVASAERRALAGLPPAIPGSPNVLMIVLDTVRADHLSPYGYHRDTSPNLARLAARGVRFEQARSTAPWTLPSHASMFTGRWPHELSARTGHPLDATYPTLAEVLSRKGYAAAGFVANTHNGNGWYGLDRGFARYEDFYRNTEVSTTEILLSSSLGRSLVKSGPGGRILRYLSGGSPYSARKDASMINRDALSWLSGREGRPFFVFLNYYDAHGPYVPPEGTAPRFTRADVPSAAHARIRRRLRQLHRLSRRPARAALRGAGRPRPAGEHARHHHVRSRRELRRASALRPRQEPVPAGAARPLAGPHAGTSAPGPGRPRAGEPARACLPRSRAWSIRRPRPRSRARHGPATGSPRRRGMRRRPTRCSPRSIARRS